MSAYLTVSAWVGTLFLAEGWRLELCHCLSCLHTYQTSDLAFLTDTTDTVHHYESQVSLNGTEHQQQDPDEGWLA